MVNYEQQQRVNFEMEGEQDSGDFLHPEKCFRSDHRCTVKKNHFLRNSITKCWVHTFFDQKLTWHKLFQTERTQLIGIFQAL